MMKTRDKKVVYGKCSINDIVNLYCNCKSSRYQRMDCVSTHNSHVNSLRKNLPCLSVVTAV